jgi:type IV pilus assembly protein PilB
MLVGETRDAETAQLAIRAALTGHLVLSTLHTNDALAAIPRLRDLGIESFLLAAALRLVAAQRLVRRLCPECKDSHPANAQMREEHGMPDAAFCRPVGCAACRGTGFRGRIAIHEVIPTAKFAPLIERDAPLAELGALREREGCVTLWQHGLAMAASGQTTVEQVARVL